MVKNNDVSKFYSEQGQMLDFLSSSISTYSAKLDTFYSDHARKSGEFIKTISGQIENALKGSTEKATEHMHAMLDSVHKKSQEVANGLAGHSQQSHQIGDSAEKTHHKAGAAASEHKSKLQELKEEFLGNLSASNLLSESIAGLSKNFELISWGLIINEMRNLSAETSTMFRNMGGNQQHLSDFIDQIAGIGLATHLSSGQVIELANAFHGEALSLSESVNPGLQAYMELSGQAMQLFGLSAESAAKFSVQMRETGHSAGEVHSTFDDLYRTMQMNNLEIGDISSSIQEASGMIDEFGAITGKSVGGLAKDLLETKALFKSMGVDAKLASKDIADVLGDLNLRYSESASIAAILGKNNTEVFNALPTAEGQQMRQEAALTQLSRTLPDLAFKNQSTLSQGDQAAVTGSIFRSSQFVGQQLHMKPEEIAPVLDKYLAKSRSSGDKADIKEFIEELRKEHQSQVGPGSFDHGLDAYNKSFANLAKNMQHALDAILIILGGPLMDILNPLISALNTVLDAFVWLADGPITKPFMEIGIYVAATMTAFHGLVAVTTMVGAGATAFGVALTAIGTACSAVVADLAGTAIMAAGWLIPVSLPLIGITAAIAALGAALWFGVPLITKAFGTLASWAGGLFHSPEKTEGHHAIAPPSPTQTFVQFKPLVDYLFEKTLNLIDKLTSGIKEWVANLFHGGAGLASAAGGRMHDIAHAAAHSIGSGAKAALGAVDSVLKGAPAEAATLPPIAASAAAAAGAKLSTGLNKPFGWLSSKHEASSPDVVADYNFKGRHNVAYGNWQMDGGMGTPQQFAAWLSKSQDADRHHMGELLKPLADSVMAGKHGEFGKQWQNIAHQNASGFLEAQREFSKQKYLSPLQHQFGAALNDPVMQELAFSTSVHSGQGGATSILKHAGVTKDSKASPELIKKIYATRDQETHGNFHGRMVAESNEALQAYFAESVIHLKTIANNQKSGMQQADSHQKQNQRDAMIANASNSDAIRTREVVQNGRL